MTPDELKAVATYLWGSPRKWQDDSRDNGLSLTTSGFTVLWIAGRKYFDYAEALLSPDGRAAMEAALEAKGRFWSSGIVVAGKYWASIERGSYYKETTGDTPAEALARAILDLVNQSTNKEKR
jgi:hypothetical protein